MDIIRKMAEPWQIDRKLADDNEVMLYPCEEFCMVTWRADDYFEHEFTPHQIVQAIRLTKPKTKRKYRYIPTLLGLHMVDDRLCLRLSCQEYSLRYMLA